MMIFGYGSLLAAKFINNRGLIKHYTENDLTPCFLKDYRRGWNAMCMNTRFLGIVESKNSKVNGVIFPLLPEDLNPFLISEGFDYPNCVYKLVNVTNKIIHFTKPIINQQIFTCVTINPCDNLFSVSQNYLNTINSCLKIRGNHFTKQFFQLTDKNIQY